MKADCQRTASPSCLHPLPLQVSAVAQFPGLLRGESPSCHNLSVDLHIMFAEFLPAGDISNDLQVMLAVHGEAAGGGSLTRVQPSALFPTLLAGCQRLCPAHPCSLLFQLSPSWLPYFAPSWKFMGPRSGPRKTPNSSGLLGVGIAIGEDLCFRWPPACPELTKGTGLAGVFLALHFRYLDIAHGAQEAV